MGRQVIKVVIRKQETDMAQIIEQEKSIQTAIRKFRKLIKDTSFENEKLQWAFPNGEKVYLNTYKLETSHGVLGVGIPEHQWNNRVPHLFTLSLEASVISPDVEINIPLTLDRKVSGVYVKNEKDIWLCSRGAFTAYRGKIKKDITFSYFNKWLLDVKDGDKLSSIIPIAALTSPDISNQIANFVSSVNDLKQKYKNTDNIDSTSISPSWNNSLEFEGKKTKNNTDSVTNYEYLHGPICNDLQRYLEILTSNTKYCVAKNKNIDMAILKNNKPIAIFEVKTSNSLSEQLYKGIGQLVSYRHFYGHPETKLLMVIPYDENHKNDKLVSLIDDLGIYLVESKEGGFIMPDGDDLSKFLGKQKIV